VETYRSNPNIGNYGTSRSSCSVVLVVVVSRYFACEIRDLYESVLEKLINNYYGEKFDIGLNKKNYIWKGLHYAQFGTTICASVCLAKLNCTGDHHAVF